MPARRLCMGALAVVASVLVFNIWKTPWSRKGAPVGDTNLSRIEAFIADYIDQHGISVLRREATDCPRDFMRRRFVIAEYSCPERIGNHMHASLNALAAAIILNRTLLWEDTSEGRACSRALAPADWTPTASEVEALWTNHTSASGFVRKRPEKWPRFGLSAECPPDSERSSKSLATNGQEQLLDRCNTTVLRLPRMYEAWLSLGGAYGHAGVKQSRFAKLRASTSTRHGASTFTPEEYRSTIVASTRMLQRDTRERASILFAAGAQVATGALFHASFGAFAAGAPTAGGLVLAVHSRHTNATDDGTATGEEESCLRRVLGQLRQHSGQSCEVLVTADRAPGIAALRAAVSRTGCEPRTAQHRPEPKGVRTGEHGPHSARGVLDDLALISRARSGVVGSKGSSFSSFVTELVLYNAAKAALPRQTSFRRFECGPRAYGIAGLQDDF